MKKRFIIVPDVHGREFWKTVVPFVDECERIIFLGDYHDPYGHENISTLESLNNFKEILDFAKEHKDKVTLLLGNHDLSYYRRPGDGNKWTVYANRFDSANFSELTKLFMDNWEMFGIITMIDVPEYYQKFLLSHAGVNPNWVDDWELIKDFDPSTTSVETVCKHIDNLFQNADEKFIESLCSISRYRGGFSRSGSMVWADCEEFLSTPETPYTQIFGHTQLKVPIIIEENNLCIDYHHCSFLDEKGDLYDLETEEKKLLTY